jgi:hypothetical protein
VPAARASRRARLRPRLTGPGPPTRQDGRGRGVRSAPFPLVLSGQ